MILSVSYAEAETDGRKDEAALSTENRKIDRQSCIGRELPYWYVSPGGLKAATLRIGRAGDEEGSREASRLGCGPVSVSEMNE